MVDLRNRQPLPPRTSALLSLAPGVPGPDVPVRPCGPKNPAAESLSRDAERQQVRQALQALDAGTRTLLVLRYFADFDSSEIGRIMQLPRATVRGRLCRARRKLADRLRQTGCRHEE